MLTRTATHDERKSGGSESLLRRVLWALGAAVLLSVVPFLSGLLGALMLFVMLRGTHSRLARLIPRRVSAFMITIGVFALILIPGTWLISTVLAELSDLVRFWQSRDLLGRIIQTPLGRFDVAKTLAGAGTSLLQWTSSQAMTLVGNVTTTLLNLAIALFGLYYLLVDGGGLWRRVKRLVPLSNATVDHLGERFASVTEALLLGTGFTAVLQGIVVGGAFALVGFRSPILWGFVTACASVLPMFGSALVWLPGVAVLLLDHRTGAAVVLGTLGAGVASNIDNVARLFVYRRVSGIHPMVTLVGAFAGVRLFGVIGAFLGPLVLSYFVELIALYEVASERSSSAVTAAATAPATF
jgi:predicted PurR-regulated permease PerM